MSGLRVFGDESDAYITVAGKRCPIPLDANGRAHIRSTPRSSAISRILLGDSVQQSDAEQPQLLLADQREGMGLQRYNEQEGLGKFRVSGWDTRFQGLLAFPPLPTQLGGALSNTGALTGFVWRVEMIAGQPTVIPLFKADAQGFASRWNGVAWAAIGGALALAITGFARFRNQYVMVAGGAGAGTIAYSTDGVTWTNGAAGTLAWGAAVHDNKFWTLHWQATGLWKLRAQSDLSTTAKVDSDDTLALNANEVPTQLVAWQFGGFPALYVLTNQRLLRYDDRTLTFHTYDDFAGRVSTSVNLACVPQAATDADGDLYVTFYNTNDQNRGDAVWQYSGNSNGPVGPNRQGGIPAANTFTFTHLAPMLHWTLGWTTQRAGTSNLPRLVAMSPQLGWGTLYESTNPTAFLIGGGYDGNGTAYLVLSNATVFALPVPDVADLPQNASGGTPPRTYRLNVTFTHRYGISDLGLPNVPKLILGVEVHARTTAGVRNALDPNVTVTPKYALDGATSFTSLAALTSLSTFPNRQSINGGLGVRCYDIEVALDGSSTVSTNSALIEAVIVYYLPLFQVREEWEVSVVTDPTHPAARGRYGENEPWQYYNNAPEDIRKHLRDNAGASALNNYRAQVVAVSFGGGALENDSTLMNVTAAEFRIQSDEDPLFGRGVMTLAISNRTLAASG